MRGGSAYGQEKLRLAGNWWRVFSGVSVSAGSAAIFGGSRRAATRTGVGMQTLLRLGQDAVYFFRRMPSSTASRLAIPHIKLVSTPK